MITSSQTLSPLFLANQYCLPTAFIHLACLITIIALEEGPLQLISLQQLSVLFPQLLHKKSRERTTDLKRDSLQGICDRLIIGEPAISHVANWEERRYVMSTYGLVVTVRRISGHVVFVGGSQKKGV